KARNPMIGSCRVGNIGSGESRHVALDATVLFAFQTADAGFKLTALIRMASLAALSIIADFRRGVREVMRIVAGDASQLVTTRLKAPAGIHLLHMADRFLLVKGPSWPDINGNKLVQGKARAIIVQPPIPFLDAEFSLEMTLL